jgi:hypothetical protein
MDWRTTDPENDKASLNTELHVMCFFLSDWDRAGLKLHELNGDHIGGNLPFLFL